MESEVRGCCSQNQCQDPFPSSERQAREGCFREARTAVRNQLQWCVQQQYNTFQLPGDDNDKDAYWNYELIRAIAALKSVGDNSRNRNRGNRNTWNKAVGAQQANDICGNDDNKKANTMQCIKDKGTFNRTSANSNWRKNSCRIKRQCNKVNQQCQQDWDNYHKPRLCDCVNTLKSNNTLRNIQQNYVQCLNRRGLRNVDQNNDDGRQIVAKMLYQWCGSGKLNKTQVNQSDPCNRPHRGNQNNGNSQNQNGNGNSQNQNQNWNGNSQNQNWNGNNPNNQPLPQQSPDYPYDDGTSAQAANANPLSGMLGGNTDILSTFTGALGGGGSGLPSLGGGGFSSLLGGGGGFPSLGGGMPSLGGGFPSLGGGMPSLGGGFPSLGGGGGGLGGLMGGGGSPLDAMSSMGGLGAGGDMTSAFGGMGNFLGGMGSVAKKK